MFALYLDDLSYVLNKELNGCHMGNAKVNHIMFADDLCCICPSIYGLQKLLLKCEEYASIHNIIFNHSKTVGMMFNCNKTANSLRLNFEPNVLLGKKKILFAGKVKYLGVMINNKLRDDTDVNRQVQSFYYIANK